MSANRTKLTAYKTLYYNHFSIMRHYNACLLYFIALLCSYKEVFGFRSPRILIHPSYSCTLKSAATFHHHRNYINTPIHTQLSSSKRSEFEIRIGDDSAKFDLASQSIKQWSNFTAAVGSILTFLYGVWIWDRGPQLGSLFKDAIEGLAGGDTTLAMVYMLGFFAVLHSGLASLRPTAEDIMGARTWRVIFALVSLPLAFSSIVYFINHRYDGIQLWDLRSEPGMNNFVFWTNLISFYFLYPSTFNLLEVAAVDKPRLRLWETGIIRITRHPQMVGQLLWCLAHSLYIGTSFSCATSAILCLHHLFAVWNGDRRLRDKFGAEAESIFNRTSVIPFQAILQGRQPLPDDYYREFLRLPYLAITIGTLLAYYAHPYMQAGATLLHR